MRVAILGKINSWQENAWKKAGDKLNHQISIISMNDVVIKIDKKRGLKVYFYDRGRVVDLKEFDCLLRRWVIKFYTQSLLVCWYMKSEGKIVINSKVERVHDKITQALRFRSAGLPHPSTYQALSYSAARMILNEIKYPVILKGIEGSLGKQVYLAKSKKQAFQILLDNLLRNVLIQEYFPSKCDYRIFVVGDKVLGAIKRSAAPGEFRNNVALGASVESVELTPKIKKMALKAARALNYEIAGVDILYHKDKPYILEVNRTPQFESFSRATGISVAEEILKYLEKLHQKSKSLVRG